MNHSPPSRSSILTLHPDPLVRAGIVASLRQHPGFDAFEAAPDAASPDTHRFAVVIAEFDQAMRLSDAAAARRSPSTARIMVLTANDREADIRRAIAAGIHGYLLLGGPVDELIEGVSTLADGRRYLGPSVAQRLADGLTQAALTLREFEVLRLVVAGEPNKVIARHLHIEVGTVKSHMTAILGKLDATSRTHAAAIAVTRGLVEQRLPVPPGPLPLRMARVEPMRQRA